MQLTWLTPGLNVSVRRQHETYIVNNQLSKKLGIETLWALCHLLAGARDIVSGSTALEVPV